MMEYTVRATKNNSGTGCWSVPEVQYKITARQESGVYRKCNIKLQLDRNLECTGSAL